MRITGIPQNRPTTIGTPLGHNAPNSTQSNSSISSTTSSSSSSSSSSNNNCKNGTNSGLGGYVHVNLARAPSSSNSTIITREFSSTWARNPKALFLS